MPKLPEPQAEPDQHAEVVRSVMELPEDAPVGPPSQEILARVLLSLRSPASGPGLFASSTVEG